MNMHYPRDSWAFWVNRRILVQQIVQRSMLDIFSRADIDSLPVIKIGSRA